MKPSTIYSGTGALTYVAGTALIASGQYTLGIISYFITGVGVILGIRACEKELPEKQRPYVEGVFENLKEFDKEINLERKVNE